jgi:hypothetical protein
MKIMGVFSCLLRMTIAGVFGRFAPFDPQGKRDDNYGFLEQPVGEQMERSDLTIAR